MGTPSAEEASWWGWLTYIDRINTMLYLPIHVAVPKGPTAELCYRWSRATTCPRYRNLRDEVNEGCSQHRTLSNTHPEEGRFHQPCMQPQSIVTTYTCSVRQQLHSHDASVSQTSRWVSWRTEYNTNSLFNIPCPKNRDSYINTCG